MDLFLVLLALVLAHQIAQTTGALVASTRRLDAQLLALTRLRAVLLNGTIDLIIAQRTVVLPIAHVLLMHADSAGERDYSSLWVMPEPSDSLEIRNVFLGGTQELAGIALQQTVDLVLCRGAVGVAIT